MGSWSYVYNMLNALVQQTDARSCVTTLSYDNLGRLVGKSYPGLGVCAAAAISYLYDNYTAFSGYTPESGYALGQRTGMTDGTGKTIWEFDARGRMVKESKTVLDGATDLGTYVTRWGYTSADQISWMIYPNGERVNYTYLPQGALDMLGQYLVGSQYDEAGRLEVRYLGNAVQVDYEYYDWDEQGGRLSGLKSGFPNIPTGVQNLEYNYDLNGNVAGILDTTNGATQMLSFGYDLLDRLTSAVATGGQGTYNQSYSYDPTSGNLASKAGVSYTYASPSHRHAVTATSNGKNFSYDANGNMTNHAGDVLTYNGENHLTQASVGGVLTTYGYDGDAQQVLVKNGSETKIYIGRHFEVRISPSIQPPTISPPPATPCLSGSVTCFYLPVTLSGVTIADPPAQREWRSYYYAGMSRIAVRVQGDTQPAGGKAFYLLGDHLGSTSVTLDEGGGKIGELRYYPWGETRWESGTTQTAYKFTGQRLDGYINLYWYNSRWFDPALSRFAQADTIVPEAIQGNQAWDRYAYVNNSPIQYTDPGGQSVDCGLGEEECQAGAYVTPSLPRLLYLSTDSIILDGGPGTGSYGQNAEDEWTGFSDSGESANDELAGLIALPGLLDWLLVFLRDNTDIRAYIGNAPEVSGRVYYDLIIDDKVMIIGVTILNTTYEAVGVTSIRETSMFQTKQLYPPDGIFISSPSYAIARPKSGSGLIAASDTVSLRGQVGIIINLMSQSGRWGSLAVSFSANANPYFCPK